MNRTIAINYSWTPSNGTKKSVPKRFEEELEESALNRILEMTQGGYNQGELCETLYDGKKPVEFRGWWKITNQEQ